MNVIQAQAPLQERLRQFRLSSTVLRRKLPSLGYAIAAFGVMLVALLVGMVTGLGSVDLTIILAGLMVLVPVIFFVSIGSMLPLLFVLVFVLQGLGQTLFNMRIATWMASGFCALFLAKTVLRLVTQRRVRNAVLAAQKEGVGVIWSAYLYLGFFFFSLALGHATTSQVISAVRFCLPMFGILFALYWFAWPIQRLGQMWKLMVVITMLQLPLVIYQHFFLVSAFGWDSVVGSFGVGMSPILVLFSLASFLYCLARWDRGLVPGWVAWSMALIVFAIILLGEVKAVALWVPVGVFVVLRRRILKNLLVFVVYCIFLLLFVAGTFLAYKSLYWGEKLGGGTTIEERYNNTSGYVFDPHAINYRTGEVSRGASLALWYSDPLPSVVERLIGYGPGASSTSLATGKGVVAARYRTLQLGATAVAQLLWDVGILGMLAYLAIICSGIVAGVRLGRLRTVSPDEGAIGDASLAILVLLATTLIYNRGVLDEPPVQLLLYFSLGCIVQLLRFGCVAGGSQVGRSVR